MLSKISLKTLTNSFASLIVLYFPKDKRIGFFASSSLHPIALIAKLFASVLELQALTLLTKISLLESPSTTTEAFFLVRLILNIYGEASTKS